MGIASPQTGSRAADGDFEQGGTVTVLSFAPSGQSRPSPLSRLLTHSGRGNGSRVPSETPWAPILVVALGEVYTNAPSVKYQWATGG